MGDVLTLIEKAEKAFDDGEAEEMARKLIQADFTLDDFLSQFQQLRKMGSLGDLLGMIPGARSALSDVEVSDRDVNRTEAIIRSMTPGERADSKIISVSRKRRIAVGSRDHPARCFRTAAAVRTGTKDDAVLLSREGTSRSPRDPRNAEERHPGWVAWRDAGHAFETEGQAVDACISQATENREKVSKEEEEVTSWR